MRVLNLYSGIGGNRKLWKDVDVTAVEWNGKIAQIYKDHFPEDKVVVGDAHQFLIENYKDYDFIWSSPPCPSHSRLNTFSVANGIKELEYPDMRLYQEILLLKHWFDGIYVVENVIPYYEPLIAGQKVGRHIFWANFFIPSYEGKKLPHKEAEVKYLQEFLGYDLRPYKVNNKRQILRNCVEPELGLHVFNFAMGAVPPIQEGLFASTNENKISV